MKVKKLHKRKHIIALIKSLFWFLTGAALGLFLFTSFFFIYFQNRYSQLAYPGITIGGAYVGGKNKLEIKQFFQEKNQKISQTQIILKNNSDTIKITAGDLEIGYDSTLLSEQAYGIGRSRNTLTNIYLIFQAYLNGINLSPSYRYSEENLVKILEPAIGNANKEPIEGLFTFGDGKVTAFRLSSDGQELDVESVKKDVAQKISSIIHQSIQNPVVITLKIKTVKPKTTTEQVNKYGIKELLSSGTSLFLGSIPNRMHNISLAASRMNGVMVEPEEVFSFNKALGDVSQFTGYKQAYVIQNGRTVLGDGGGVCQVSTTFFRAVLNAGLPIVERHAHAYRVGYYEQDSLPGLDATIYTPTVDFRFKNDTGHYILIQSAVDFDLARITFFLYGTRDNREVSLTKPVISSQTSPPEPLYQDDPSLPMGTVKQVDFPSYGANVSFSREVKKNGKIIISETYSSNYRAWQAVYLRGSGT